MLRAQSICVYHYLCTLHLYCIYNTLLRGSLCYLVWLALSGPPTAGPPTNCELTLIRVLIRVLILPAQPLR
jgi:hypothetical protein